LDTSFFVERIVYNNTIMSSNIPDSFGAEPVSLKWKVVRGDTARLRVEFWQNDETTKYDTSTWTYLSSVYDIKGDTLNSLNVTTGTGYVDITATPEMTATWGTGYNAVAAELSFDLQITIDADTVWTPILGTIVVLSDVTPVGGP
jgi:hypothetical protein